MLYSGQIKYNSAALSNASESIASVYGQLKMKEDAKTTWQEIWKNTGALASKPEAMSEYEEGEAMNASEEKIETEGNYTVEEKAYETGQTQEDNKEKEKIIVVEVPAKQPDLFSSDNLLILVLAVIVLGIVYQGAMLLRKHMTKRRGMGV